MTAMNSSITVLIKKLLRLSFARFFIVGVMNTFVDFALLNLLVFLGYTASFSLFGQMFLIANILSFGIAMIHSFLWNKRWAFSGSDSTGGSRQFILFVAITITSVFIINQLVFNILYFNVPLTNIPFLSLNIAKIIAGVLSTAINYFSYRYIVFPNTHKN